MPQYEVWCHSCNVTFPKGTKVCMHCGRRTRPESPGWSPSAGLEPGDSSMDWDGAMHVPPELPSSEATTEPEEEPGRRSVLRAGMTVLWMVLLAAGYAWRACSSS